MPRCAHPEIENKKSQPTAYNDWQGLSYHGWKLGIPVTVVMPMKASLMKIQKCRNYHANVVVQVCPLHPRRRVNIVLTADYAGCLPAGVCFLTRYFHIIFTHQNTLAGRLDRERTWARLKGLH